MAAAAELFLLLLLLLTATFVSGGSGESATAVPTAPAAAAAGEEEHHNNGAAAATAAPPALPFCERHVGKLPSGSSAPLARDAVRDTLQQLQAAHRTVRDLKEHLHHKNTGPDRTEDPDLARAYATPLTPDQLQQALEAAEQHAARIRGHLSATVEELRRRGWILPSTTEALLSVCLMGRLNPRLYPDRPQISFMLQYFQRPWMIQPILSALRSCSSVQSELLVNVDSLGGEEHQIWSQLAHNSSGYVVPVFSADVHEIRAYNRLAGLSRGKVVVVLQDDLIPPKGCKWQADVLAAFDAHPRLGALGLKSYRFNTRKDNVGVNGRELFFRDPRSGLGMQFVQMVDFAPMALLRSAFRYVGGLDEGLSDAGMCGIYSDFELSVRMWAGGWQVAYLPITGTQPDSSGVASGTHKPETEARCWRRQMGLAGSVHEERWWGPVRPSLLQEALALHVRSLNLGMMERVPEAHCPFSEAFGGCDPAWVGMDVS